MEDKYFVHLFLEDIIGIGQAQILGENYSNMEINKTTYDTISDRGLNYYKYVNGELVLNPNYEQEQTERANIERNFEIDQKIKELLLMSLQDLLEDNKENISLYLDVINGLEISRPAT